MPRLDRTFRGTDVIRIYEENLDFDEQARVRLFFTVLARLPSEPDVLDDILDKAIDIATDPDVPPIFRRLLLRFHSLLTGRN